MKKAIILSRVSSNHQDLDQQTEAVIKAVYSDGFNDSEIIVIEDKESAIKLSEEERNGLNRLKEYIRNDPQIKTVYLYELSRLSRRQLVMFSIRDFLIEHNVQLICLNPYFRLLDENGKISPMGSMAFSMFSSFAENEMILKKERMIRGRKHNISVGKIGSGRPPFGYSVDKDKYYIIDPIQSEIVKRFFTQYSKGDVSIADIAKELKEEGLFPKTSFDTLQTNLSCWLEREFYVGINPYPQIISKSLFDKVQSVRRKRKSAPKKKYSNSFLLKGLIFDENSGRCLCGWTGGKGYILTHSKGEGMMIKRKLIDPLVWDYAKKMYQKYIMNRSIYKRQLTKEILTIGKKMQNIKDEIQSLKDKMDKVEERMIFGKLSSKRGDELLEKLSESHSDNERRLLQLTNESASKQQQLIEADYMEDFNEDNLSLDDKISIVRKVVKKITIARPIKTTAHVSIFNTINDTVTVYAIRGRKYQITLLEEYQKKNPY